jgi:hypothetical protein
MTGDERADEIVRAWVQAGPDGASAEFVERTLRPVPRMRQRRSWRIVLERVSRPVLAGAAAVALVAVFVVGIGGFSGFGGVGAPAPTPIPVPTKPTFELTFKSGPGAGTYTPDPATTLNICTHATDGSWRLLYAGGDPFVNLDLLVGPDAGTPDGASDVAAEIYAGPGYVRFDPGILRGGDAKGRSTASVAVGSALGATTFTITATTPDLSNAVETSVDIDLSVTCPN